MVGKKIQSQRKSQKNITHETLNVLNVAKAGGLFRHSGLFLGFFCRIFSHTASINANRSLREDRGTVDI